MRKLLPLLLLLLLIGTHFQETLAQSCPTLSVSLPAADKNYCGPRPLSFSSSNPDHAPTYPVNTATINSYTWTVNGTVVATSQYPSINFPTEGVYTVVIRVTNTCGEAASDTQIIRIENTPFAPTVDDVAACTGSSATLWVNNPNPNLRYRWYDSNGNLLVWGTSYTKTNATSSTYQIEALTSGGCVSPRTTAQLSVSSAVGNAGTIGSEQEICSGTRPAMLSGNAPQSMTFQWFQSTIGANTDFYPISSARDKDFWPPVLSQTTWYKRVAYNGGCGEESNTVKITVSPVPTLPVVSDAFVCSGTRARLTVTNADPSTVYRWYATATSTTEIGTGPTFTSPNPITADVNFYVSASTAANATCNMTTARAIARVKVTASITNNTIVTGNQSICSGGTPVPMDGSLPQGGGGGYIYQWQRSTNNGSTFTDIPGANAQGFAPGPLTAPTWYRRKVRTASDCPESFSNTVQIAVAPLAASIDIAEPQACMGSGTTIIITNPEENYTYRWYDVATGGSVLATGVSFPTGPLTSNKIYYVDAVTSTGCYTSRRSVEVKVTAIPAAPVVNEPTICAGASATLTVNPADAALFYRWYTNGGTLLATGTSYQTGPLTANTTYYVEAVTNAAPGCASTRKAVTVSIIPVITNNTIANNQQICSGTTPAALTGSLPEGGGGGYIYQWAYSEDNVLFTPIAGATGRNYTPGPLTITTSFRRSVSAAGSCPPVTSNVIKVEVNPIPAVPVVPAVTICSGITATLKVSAPDADLIYNWYTTASGTTPFATNVNTITTEVLTSNKTYYVEAITAAGCRSTSRAAVTVTVSALPAVPVADNVAICAGNIARLAVVAPNASLRYQWFDAATGGTLLASGTSFTTPVLQASATYYVQAVNNNECASSSRRAVTVAVTSLPEIPEVTGATICSGNNTTLYITDPDPALLYRWYAGNTLLTTGTSFTTGNLTASTTYAVEAVTNNASACTSAGRRTVAVNVILPITNNTISSNQTICSGGTPAPLTGSTATGGSGPLTYQWEKSGDGANYAVIAGATNLTYNPGPLTAPTWYRRRVKGNDSCPENVSNAIQITVNSLPANPVADGKTICINTATTLSVNAPVAGISYKWYNAAAGGNILSNDPTLQTNNLSNTTTYYIEATNAAGCTSARQPVTVTVKDLPEMPMAASQQICQGQNTTLSVTSPNSALTYKWYNASGDLLSSQTSLNITNLSASVTYFLEANYTSNPICASPRREVIVTVTPLPDQPMVNDISICTGTKGILQVQGANPNLTYTWYTASSGGTAIGTGATFETPGTLTSSRTYYVEAATATGCSSGRKAVTITVNPLPATPFANNTEICAGASALLTVSDAVNTLTYHWYASNTAVTPLATGVTYSTGALTVSTTFYLEAVTTATGCVSATRRAVQVLVTELPAVPTAANKTICAGGSAVLSVESPSASLIYKWYNAEGTQVGTGINFNTGSLPESKNYYLEAVTNTTTACASASRRTVAVTVIPAIANNIVSANQTICSGSTPAPLLGSEPNGGGTSYAYQWEQSTDGSNYTVITGATSQHYTPGVLTANRWFRRKVSATGPCAPDYSNSVQIITVTPPGAPLADNKTICAGNVALLTIREVNPAYSYRWYSSAAGGNILQIATDFETPELNATTTYYVEAVNANGCVSARKAVTVNVTTVPALPVVADQLICAGQKATLIVSSPVQNQVYRWYTAAGTLAGTGTSFTTPDPLSASTTYLVEASTITTPACVSGRKAVMVSVAEVPATPEVENVTICSGSTASLSVKVTDPAMRYKWYTVPTGGTPVKEASTYTTTALTSNRIYYVEAVSASGCTSPRAALQVMVTSLPAVPVANNETVCAGSTATLTVTNDDANLVYNWYDAATDGNLLATGTLFTTRSLQTSTTYYLEAVTSNGCKSASRKAVTVNVTPLPVTPQVNNATICAGSNVTLWVTNQTSGVIYKWYDGTGVYLATGNSYTTQNLTTSTPYEVEAVTTSSIACASAPRKTVLVTVVSAVSNNIIGSEQTICTGSTPATLTGSVPAGGNGTYIYQWERSTDGLNYTVITGATSQQYSPAALSTETWFRRKASSAGSVCAEHISNVIRIAVVSQPVTPQANGTTICAGTTATLSVSNPDNTLTYRWYETATAANNISLLSTFTTPELNENKTYYVEAINASGCISSRRAVPVTVRQLPEVPVVADKAICSGQTTTLAVTAPVTGINYKWFNADNTLLTTGTSFTTPVLDRTTVYYVEASYITSPTCSSTRAAVTVAVTALPSAPLVAGISICSGNAGILSISAVDPNLTYKWYAEASGGTALATSINFTTPILTSAKTYYVEAVTASGCASARTMVAVEVNAVPATPVADPKTICTGTATTLSVNALVSGVTYKWYTAATGGNLLSTEPSLQTEELSVNTTYYVEAVSAKGCSSSRRSVTVTVKDLPEMPAAADKTICAGQSTTLSVTSPDAALTYKWYNEAGQVVSTALSFSVTGLQTSTTYYLEALYKANPVCASPRREVMVTVTPLPALPVVNDITICSGTKGILRIQDADPGLTYKWYTAASGGTAIATVTATDPTYTTPALTSARTYYVEAITVAGCMSSRKAVTVNVSPLPATPFADNEEICAGEPATLAVSDADGSLTYNWYASNTAVSPLTTGVTYSTGALSTSTTFYLEAMTASGCVSTRRAVQVLVTARPAVPNAANKTICAGGSATLTVLSPSASLLYKWYNDEGTEVATGTIFNTEALNENTTFYLEAVTNTPTACASSARKSVTVTVTPVISNNTISANQTICSSSRPAPLLGSVPNGGGTGYAYQWEQSTDGSNYTVITGATSQQYTPGVISTSTWFRRKVSATGPCAPDYSNPVQIITVTPPGAPVADNVTVCAGSTAMLTIRDANPNLTYHWYGAASGGTVLKIANSFETPELSATTTYYVEAVNANGCLSPRRAVTANVTVTPALPAVSDQSICAGQKATLTVSAAAPDLVYTWYDQAGTLVGSGASFTTPNSLSVSTTYYVEAATVTSPACVSGRKAVAVAVTAMPDPPVAENVTICAGSTATLSVRVVDPAITYKWYTAETGGTPVKAASNFTTTALTSNRTYYVEAVTASGCTSARTPVVVTVTPLPATPSAENVTICARTMASLTVTNPVASLVYHWYDAATDGNLLATGTDFTTRALSGNTTFYLEAATNDNCASTRKAVTVNVTPLPVTPEVNNATVCAGSNVTLWVTNQASGVIYNWYDNAGVYLATGSSYTIQNVSASTTFSVEAVTNTGVACASAPRKIVAVTVVPPISANTIGADQTVCTGTVPATFIGSIPAGGNGNYTYQWERSNDGINFTAIAGAVSQHYTPTGTVSSDTWFRRRVKATGSPCAEHISNILKVTEVAPPAAPLANNLTICAGTTALLQISNPDNALIYRWYETATGGNPLQSSPDFETSILDRNTTFYVEATNANGCQSARRAVTVSVTPLPETPVVTANAICAGQTTTLAITSPVSGLRYRWYTTDGILLTTGTTYTTPALNTTTTYLVEATTSGNPVCVSSSRRTVTVPVTPLPQAPVVENKIICEGSSATLSVSVIDPKLTYKWYTAATGGTPVASAISFKTPALTSPRKYYVAAETASGCASARSEVQVGITPLPAAPITSNVTICAGQTATVSVQNPDNNLIYNWYDAATDGNLLASGDTYTTGTLRNSTNFFVAAQTADGCVSSSRTPVTVNVTPAPATPDADNATICANGSVTLWVKNPVSGVNYQWYQEGILRATGNSYTTANLTVSTTYTLEAVTTSANACVSASRKEVVVTVIPVITNNIISTNQTICTGSVAASLTGSVPAGGNSGYAYQWEYSTDGTNFTSLTGAVSAEYTPAALTANTWFRRKVTTAGPCAANYSNLVKITVINLPATPVASNVTICAGTTATLQVRNPDNTLDYRWYETATGGNSINLQPSFSTPELPETKTYYVEAVNETGCPSARRAVTVTIRPSPEVPVIAGKSICTDQATTLAVTAPVTGVNYQWFTTDGTLVNTGTSFTTPALDRTTVYYVEATYVTAPNCTSTPRASVTVVVTPVPQAPAVAGASVCSGQAARLSVSVVDPNLTYKWYTVATGGTAVAASAAYTTPVLTSAKIYYVEAVTAAGCAGPRTTVNVTVTPLPAIPAADNLEVCSGTTAMLSVTNPDNNLTYKWYDAGTDGRLLATGETYPVININASATFYVEAETATGCVSPARKAVEVTVTPLPLTPQVNNATVCAGQTATLTVIMPEASAIYKWYNAGGLIFTGTTFTSPALQANTVYYVEAVTNNRTACASSSRRTVTVTVTPAIADNSISADQTICSGSAPGILNGTTPTGGEGNYTYQWERSLNGSNFSDIPGATEKNYLPGVQTGPVWFRRKVRAAGTCQPNESNIVQITVIPQPTAPVVPAITVCEEAPATLQISNASNTLTYNWYSQVSGGNSLHTGQSFTVADLAASVTYYVEAVNSNGCTSTRRAVTITVIAKPETPLAANQEICYGQAATLRVTAPVPSLIYRWYNGDGDLLRTGTSFSPENLTTSTTFYLEASTTTTPACVSDRSAINVFVTSLPALPVVENVTICSGSTARLAVKEVDPALTYKWYTVPTGGTPEAEVASFTTSALTSSRNYYVEAVTASGCPSGRVAVAVTVTALPATPVADNVSICSGTAATLTVTAPENDLIYKWYDAATDGNLLATGETYTTRVLNSSTTFYVAAVTPGGCASTARRPVTVNVTPLPATPEVDNATICRGGTVTLWIKNPEPGLVYRWYEGNLLHATGTSFTPDNLASSTTYQVEAVTSTVTTAGNTCNSSSRETVTVTVVQVISNNSISNNQTICSGGTPARLTGSLPAGGGGDYAYQWESSEDGLNFTAIANATSPEYTPAALSATTFFRRRVTAAGPCAVHISNSVTITVTPLPAAPVADNATICAGTTTVLSVRDANTNYTYRWFNTATGGSTLFIGASYPTPVLSGNATYYVEAVNATGCTSARRAVAVTVTPQPDAPLTTNKIICAGEQAFLTVDSPEANLTYRWYNGTGVLLATGTTYTTNALSTNTTYYVEAVTATQPACVSSRSSVAVLVTPLPTPPIADDATICTGNSARLAVKVIDQSLTYKWYSVASGGTPIATGTNFTTNTLTSNRTFYVEAVTASGCASASRDAVTVTVTPQPAPPVVADRTICAGNRASLAVTSPDAALTYRWYDRNGAALATGTNYTTDALTNSTLYYVEAVTLTSPGCASTRRTVAVNVTPLPTVPEVDAVTICAGATATLAVKNPTPAVLYNWYDETETLVGTGTTFTTATLSADATYQVEATTASGCASPAREQVVVAVTPPITNNLINTDQTICSGNTPAQLLGSVPVGGGGSPVYEWQSSEDGVNFISIVNATGKDYTPEALSVPTWFRRRVKAGSTCAEQISNLVKITVINLPDMPQVAGTSVCAGNSTTLRISSPEAGLSYRWFATATGGSSLAAGTSYRTGILTSTTTYYVEAVNTSGCAGLRRPVTVSVTPLPATPQALNKTVCVGEKAILSVTSPNSGISYRWFDGNGILLANNSSYTTPALQTTTVFYVEAITAAAPTCSSPRKAVTVTVTPLPDRPEADEITVCANNTAIVSVKQADPALTYKWYSVATGGVPLTIQPSYETTVLTSNQTYFVEAVTTSGCVSERRAVRVNVTPLPATPQAANKAVCVGQNATLSVIAPDGNLTYRWYDTGGNIVATGTNYTVVAPKVSTTVYLEAETAGGCASATRKAVVISVTPLPEVPAVENAIICAGSKVTLFVKNPDPALEYRWYADAAATNQLGSGISFTPADPLFSGKSFFMEAVNTAGCTSAIRKQVDVAVTGKPNAPVVENATVCAGSTATLSVVNAEGNLVYKWFDTNGTLLHTGTTYTTVPVSSKAVFNVTAYTGSNSSCSSASHAVTVNITATITGNIINKEQTICSGEAPARLSGSLPAGGNAATLSYQWEQSEDGVNFAGIVGANAQDYAPDNLSVTTWFRRKVKAAGPCAESVSKAVRVTVVPLPDTPQADNVTVCAGSPASLMVKNPFSAINNVTYRWYNTASGGTALGTGISFRTPTLTASTTFYVEAARHNGCSSLRRAVVVLVNQPVTNNTVSSDQVICLGSKPADLLGSIPDGGNGTSGFTYQWQRSNDNNFYTDIAGATGQHYTLTEAPTRTVWFRRKVKAAGPCEEYLSNTAKIEVVPAPLAPTVTNAAICPGNRVTLEAKAMAGLTVEWYDAPRGGNLLFVGDAYQTPVLATTTSYWVQTVNSSNCASTDRQEAKVSVVPPQVTVSNDITITEGKPVQLLATGGVSYIWSSGTGLSNPKVADPVARPTETTTYTVTINTKEGCSVTKQVTVTVLPTIKPGNVFTPNNDGFNDYFEIKHIGDYPDCSVEVFTRWGEKVFESKGYNQQWDGTKNGKALPMGAYYYMIRLHKNDKPISGSVTLVK